MINSEIVSQSNSEEILHLSKFYFQKRILLKKIFLFASAFFLHSFLSAQTLSPSVISSAGSFDVAGGMSLSSTIGQSSAIESFIAPSIILTQGFQQPEDDATIVGIETMINESLQITAYPNPMSDILKIQYYNPKNRSAQAELLDLLGGGTMEVFDLVSNATTSLNISSLPAGIYFLKVKESNHSVTIKIIKAQ